MGGFLFVTESTEVAMLLDQAKRIALRSRNNERLMHWGRVLAAALVIIGGLDIVSTNAALAAGQIEANPLVRPGALLRSVQLHSHSQEPPRHPCDGRRGYGYAI